MTSSKYTMQQEYKRLKWLEEKIDPLPNKKLDGAMKIVLRGLSREYSRRGIQHTQKMKIWYPNIADWTGLSVDSVQSSMSKLDKLGLIIKETVDDKDEKTKQRRKRTYVCFTPEALTNPAELLADIEDSNHGGKRVSIQCPHCKEYHPLRAKTTNACTGCGVVIEELTTVKIIENVSPEELGRPQTDAQREELARLDQQIKDMDCYGYDAADIPDDVIAYLGNDVGAALNADSAEIAAIMSKPRHEREGLEDEDMAAIDELAAGMRQINLSTEEPMKLSEARARKAPTEQPKTRDGFFDDTEPTMPADASQQASTPICQHCSSRDCEYVEMLEIWRCKHCNGAA